MYQNQDKKNLKWVARGLDVGHEDRTRIKSLVFVFAYFLRFISFPASYFYLMLFIFILVFVLTLFLDPTLRRIGYYWSQMIPDAIAYAKQCNACQIHGDLIHQASRHLCPTTSS